jgi:putative peptidoglycan lipid II flippase
VTEPAQGEQAPEMVQTMDGAAEGGSALARTSLSIALWTLLSRGTGFIRIAVTAAVLGPTYLSNTFQAVNSLPNTIVYQLLMGSLFVSLLVPALVPHADAGRPQVVERVVGAFLSLVTAAFAIVSLLALVCAPVLLSLFSAGVPDNIAPAQEHVAFLFLIMTLPQTICYGVVSCAIGVMNAYNKFTLAVAAPCIENIVTMAALGAAALIFGTHHELTNVSSAEIVLLGLGATGAVALHAAAQWWGVHRLGIRFRLRAGWRDPDVLALVRRVRPAFSFAALDTLRTIVILAVVNEVAGGVIAFQLALQLTFLVIALGVTPVATALLPQLSRLHAAERAQEFRDEMTRGAALVYFLAIPAVAAYVVLVDPLSRAVSFGEMSRSTGVELVAVAVLAMAPGILAESWFYLAYQASYARHDPRTPLIAQLVGTAVSFVGIVAAIIVPASPAVVAILGGSLSAGQMTSAWYLRRRLRRSLPAAQRRILPSLLRAGIASLLALTPAYVLLAITGGPDQSRASLLAWFLVAAVVALAVYLAVHWLWRSPELQALRARARPGPAPEEPLAEGASDGIDGA